jgi:phosphate/sulfate permease
MIATRYSWPVSTTYSITSALTGVGIAVGGGKAVNWRWDNTQGSILLFSLLMKQVLISEIIFLGVPAIYGMSDRLLGLAKWSY